MKARIVSHSVHGSNICQHVAGLKGHLMKPPNFQILQGQGDMEEYEGSLKQAQVVQEGVLEGVRGDHPDLIAAHKQTAAEMQMELAHLYASQQKPGQVTIECLLASVCVCLSVCFSWRHCAQVSLSSQLSAQQCVTVCRSVSLSVNLPVNWHRCSSLQDGRVEAR